VKKEILVLKALRETKGLKEIQARLDLQDPKDRKVQKEIREIKETKVNLEQIWKYIFVV
jgi:hypothetical protein